MEIFPRWKFMGIVAPGILLAVTILLPHEIVLAGTTTPPPPLPENPGQAVFNPLGIGTALLFAALMTTLFRWMFKVPPKLPYNVVKARQSVSALRRILVPSRPEIASERAVELACRLGESQKAEIILVYVIEVPFTLSLNADMPTEEAKGEEALQTARFIINQHGLPVKSRIIHHRNIWGGILAVAREELVDAIVMNSGQRGSPESLSGAALEVIRRSECEVILDRAPHHPVAFGMNGVS